MLVLKKRAGSPQRADTSASKLF